MDSYDEAGCVCQRNSWILSGLDASPEHLDELERVLRPVAPHLPLHPLQQAFRFVVLEDEEQHNPDHNGERACDLEGIKDSLRERRGEGGREGDKAEDANQGPDAREEADNPAYGTLGVARRI